VVVEGHTDNQGSPDLNQTLSQNRAASVVDYLQTSLNSAFYKKAFASAKPVADNRTTEGRQKNRRVEIYVYIRE
jgi:outer membrane protein OmpA-like peptidoglycan-associated protein